MPPLHARDDFFCISPAATEVFGDVIDDLSSCVLGTHLADICIGMNGSVMLFAFVEGRDSPEFETVKAVFGSCYDLQIFQSIVISDCIEMVDVQSIGDWATEGSDHKSLTHESRFPIIVCQHVSDVAPLKKVSLEDVARSPNAAFDSSPDSSEVRDFIVEKAWNDSPNLFFHSVLL